MLADESKQLLTGYVDGELSSRQRKTVLRLLHESSEARELLLSLQENAHKIKQLPRRKLDPGFAGEVVQLIAQRNGKPERPYRPAVIRLRWLPYAAAAAAAAVLFVITLGGGIYLALRGDAPDIGFVQGDEEVPPAVQQGVNKINPKLEPEPLPPPRKPPNPLIAKVTEGVYAQYAAVIPPDRQTSVTFKELRSDGQGVREFASQIKKHEALELEVTVRSNPQAVERLKSVLAQVGVKLVIDPASDAILKKGPGKAEFLIYAENVSRDELTKLLKQLAADDKKGANPFDKVAVAALSAQDDRLVTSLFGTDPKTRSDGTTIGIKKGPKVPTVKGERVAVVLPQAPEKSASEEVRQFLYQKALPLPGSIPVLIRLRQE